MVVLITCRVCGNCQTNAATTSRSQSKILTENCFTTATAIYLCYKDLPRYEGSLKCTQHTVTTQIQQEYCSHLFVAPHSLRFLSTADCAAETAAGLQHKLQTLQEVVGGIHNRFPCRLILTSHRWLLIGGPCGSCS